MKQQETSKAEHKWLARYRNNINSIITVIVSKSQNLNQNTKHKSESKI